MSVLTRELLIVQNPALGAVLLWRFAVGFERNHPSRAPVPLPLLFIVLPMLLHARIVDVILSTREASGLRTFADKFLQSSVAGSDELLAVHDRAQAMRRLTLQSIGLATACRLVHVYPDEAAASPLSHTFPSTAAPGQTRSLLRAAERLGAWCGELTLHEVAGILKVAF